MLPLQSSFPLTLLFSSKTSADLSQFTIQAEESEPHHLAQPTLSSSSTTATTATTTTKALHKLDISSISDIATIAFELDLPEGKCVGLELKYNAIDAISSQKNETEYMSNLYTIFSAILHPDELNLGQTQYTSSHTRTSFYLGRLATRYALSQLGIDAPNPILKDKYGRPVLPLQVRGSISHKGPIGVALVSYHGQASNTAQSPTMAADSPARESPIDVDNSSRRALDTGSDFALESIGIDLEYCTGSKSKIAPKVLTDNERQNLGCIEVSLLFIDI
jgi:4'-phosphopantetheinyl transferase EntD